MQQYQQDGLMSCIYIAATDLIDQLPDDQHKLDGYVEIGNNYNVWQSNAEAFKTLNTNTSANSIVSIKTYKSKSKS